jgi:hypothetical protein
MAILRNLSVNERRSHKQQLNHGLSFHLRLNRLIDSARVSIIYSAKRAILTPEQYIMRRMTEFSTVDLLSPFSWITCESH